MGFFSRLPLDAADEFPLFSTAYFIGALVSILILILCYIYFPKLKDKSYEKYIRYFLAVYLMITIFEINLYFYQNSLPWYAYIPEGLCGISVVLSAYVLITKNRTAFVILFFWGWGAFIAIFAPNINEGPNYYYFYQFYLRHLLIVIGAMYMMRVFDYKIYPKDYLTYVFITLPLAMCSLALGYIINADLYSNYLYMVKPVIEGTPLDWFYGIHPLFYTVIWILIAFVFAFLYGLPFYQKNLKSEIV